MNEESSVAAGKKYTFVCRSIKRLVVAGFQFNNFRYETRNAEDAERLLKFLDSPGCPARIKSLVIFAGTDSAEVAVKVKEEADKLKNMSPAVRAVPGAAVPAPGFEPKKAAPVVTPGVVTSALVAAPSVNPQPE